MKTSRIILGLWIVGSMAVACGDDFKSKPVEHPSEQTSHHEIDETADATPAELQRISYPGVCKKSLGQTFLSAGRQCEVIDQVPHNADCYQTVRCTE